MAKAKNSEGSKGGQGAGFILALVVLTLVGGGAGALFGMQMNAGAPAAETEAANGGAETAQSDAKGEAKSAPKHGEAAKGIAASAKGGSNADGEMLVMLDPIFANLAEPGDVWMRLEAALMIKAEVEERDVLVAKVSQDVMQFLRTVKLAQLEDASGLQFLRDDLNDIVRSRSEGKISELLVKGLIVE